ncbi:MAG: carbohydrate ABC transporter permease [Alphaproteobacteria bacterium]
MIQNKKSQKFAKTAFAHLVLISYTALAILPVLLVFINSFKDRKTIFRAPLALPFGTKFDLGGYQTVLENSNVWLYFGNSLIVTVASLTLILLFGAMAAFALSEYRFKFGGLFGLFFAFGIMIPIRLGTLGIVNIFSHIGLMSPAWGKLASLILIYTAHGLPLAVFILTEFMRSLSGELKEAARIDGFNEYQIFFKLVLPLVRPAMATVAVFNLIPIWNDLWFPLVIANFESTKTIILWAQDFKGQFSNNYPALLASLSLAIAPAIILYLIFSRQLIRGITSGAVK